MPDEPQVVNPPVITDDGGEVSQDTITNASVMEKMMKEEGGPDEVESVDEKAVSTTPVEDSKTPEEEGATTTPPDAKSEENADLRDPDAKEEVKSEEADKAKIDEKAAEDPDQAELNELEEKLGGIRLKDSAKPATKKALTASKNISREIKKDFLKERKLRKEVETKLAEREALKVLDEPTQQELNDLRNFRKTVAIEQDPEFKDAYDKKLEALDTQAQQVFTSNPTVPKGTADFIAANGGPRRFRVSQNYMPTGLKDAQGNAIAAHEDGTPFTHREFWEKVIAPALNPDQVDEINAIGLESRQVERERKQKIDEAKSNVGEWEKKRGETRELEQKEFTERFTKRAEDHVKSFGDITTRKEVPTNATKEEKDKIDKENSRIDRAEGIAKRYSTNLTPESHAEMVVNSAYVETMKEVNKELEAERDKEKEGRLAAEQKLVEYKKAGKTSDKVSAPIHQQAKSIDEEESPEKRMDRMLKEGMK